MIFLLGKRPVPLYDGLLRGVTVGLWDYILGTYPSAWSAAQRDAFDSAYDKMISGVFGWTDFIPPTDLAGAGTTMMGLSLKALVQFGNKGTTALDVEAVHNLLLQTSAHDIFDMYQYTKFNRVGTGLTRMQVFCMILRLESLVYGSRSAWDHRRSR